MSNLTTVVETTIEKLPQEKPQQNHQKKEEEELIILQSSVKVDKNKNLNKMPKKVIPKSNKENSIKISPKKNPKILNETFTQKTDKKLIDKSTSPEHTSSNSLNWNKERILQNEIDSLKETLMDTEERFQSLRIQHDSLSQIHRDVKDNQNQLHDESERLKLDIQHINVCANVLRGELSTARSDRIEAMEIQKSLQQELDENRLEKKKTLEENVQYSKTIQDLQRQCKEMERILMRKQPDSVSGLIVPSPNSSSRADDKTTNRRQLEQRISQLESDAKEQDQKAQKILCNVQARFTSVQSKYETHIGDLETQVLSLQEINSKLNEKVDAQNDLMKLNNRCMSAHSTQTEDIPEKEFINRKSVVCQTDSKIALGKPQQTIVSSGSCGNINGNSFVQSGVNKKSKILNFNGDQVVHGKDDAHLLATIRGMRVDLAIKEKALQRLTRDLDECKKTIKKLQKERDGEFFILFLVEWLLHMLNG